MRLITPALLLLLSAACGTGVDDQLRAHELTPALPEAEPLVLSEQNLGVGVRSGAAVASAFFAPNVYNEVVGAIPHAVLHVQAYDEAAPTFGEYIVYSAPPETNARTASDFLGANASAGRFERRVADLYDELDTASAEAGSSFTTQSVVLNLWRLRKDWWVRWDGNVGEEANQKGRGSYGMFRRAMYNDVLDQVEEVASTHKPAYFIVGDEMELLLAGDDGEGFSAAEWINFVQFYREAAKRIKAASPSTKVGAGINWDRFVTSVAPMYVSDGDTEHTEVLWRAFTAVVLPLAEAGDVLALKSYRGSDDPDIAFPLGDLTVTESYQFLRHVVDRHALPIAFYSVGSPVTTSVGYLAQRNFLESFQKWTAGLEPELVAWRYLQNFDGTDTANQQVTARCEAFTTSTRQFEMPASACYDGLITSVFSTKPAFDLLAGD